jgi:hypothetical protein
MFNTEIFNKRYDLIMEIGLREKVSGLVRSQMGEKIIRTITEPVQQGISVAIRLALKGGDR